jgi:secreted protein with Ig-like and vWFA domain
MNDDTDKPLNTVGDDALEARITAWVLGEASSFEAGELEKLCAADPALGLFERRLRVLHGLVAEDFKAGPAAEWKLSAERRAKITDLLGVAPEVEQKIEARRRKSRGPSVRGMILALAACVVLGFISISLLGGVGESARMVGVKSSVSHDRFRAEAPMAMAPAADAMDELEVLRSERGSLRLERESGVPVNKPDTSYTHLATNSPFSSKPPPAAIAEVTQPRGAVALQEDVVGDKRKLQAGVEASADGFDRDAVAPGVTTQSAVEAKAELDVTSNSLALLKEKSARSEAAGMPEQPLARRSELEGISGPPPAPATPAPASAAKPAALAQNEVGAALTGKGEANGRGFVGGGMVGGGGAGGGLPAESAPEITVRRSTDFISTVDGVTIPGLPAAPGTDVTDIVTAGNRSGDGVITRNNIDAVLNNPARREKAEAKGDAIAALTGTFSDEATAMLEKSVEEMQEGAKNELGSGVASGPVAEFQTRNPKPGEPVSGAPEGKAASLADAGGMLLEPAAESRFGRGLPTGGEQVMGQDDAADFGNQEELSRLSRNRQQVELGNNFSYSDITNGGGTGGTELMDLAKKQNEGGPDTAAAGRWFGTATDETTKGLKDTNAPSGATADPFFDSPPLVGKPLGGLKRDLSEEPAAAPVEAEGEVRAKMLEQVDKAWELSVLPVEADEFDGFVNQGTPIADGSADGPVPVTPAPAVTDPAAMEDVRRKLYTAEGGYNLGKYDEAQKAYEEVLRIDPYNKAARRGMEQVATARQDYYRAAYDQTRAQLLVDGDEAQEASPTPEQKKQAALDLMSEVVSADEPFSTFSLHVSDASFKLAQAAMERGEVPAAEGIRPEEFYNAFDYGDPAPASGEPVVCVTEQSAHPAFAQRNLLRIGVRTGSQGRGASTPLNLTLLLDHSGSMEREDRNAGLAMAVRQLSSLLKEGDTITVAGFSRQPRLLADRLPGARAQELNELIARTPSEGGTNLEEGLKLGEELAKRQFNPAAQNRVVLFTDGAANLGDARPEALQARIEGLRQQGIAFDAAGFGADGLNDKLLERLTRNGNGRYYVVDGPEDADAGFAKQLAGAFRPAAENVKVQVRFNPARVAKYKLIGFEEHRLQKEDFRNDAVDAAEMAAEEAGNALYQIETLPQGEGEVGEVSVRFRDVASGQMVERTWTIPYDAQAPAFDKATPSIQLAGLAAFTAEKLRAAPMADAVDFQQLGQVYAGVRARYPNSKPVADLGSMIGKMK